MSNIDPLALQKIEVTVTSIDSNGVVKSAIAADFFRAPDLDTIGSYGFRGVIVASKNSKLSAKNNEIEAFSLFFAH